MEFEVVVCGAGPAGSTAARKAAEAGRSVLLIDRKKHPGLPVFCAEGISRSMVADYLEIKPEWISSKINGSYVVSNDVQTFISYPDVGYILDREKFDYGLVQLAVQAGAEFITGEITDVEKDHLIVDNVKEIRFKIPIIADGVESRLARKLGVDTTIGLTDIHTCAQFMITGIDHDEDKVSFILDQEMIPGGYGWVFPKGVGRFNFGLGIAPQSAKERPIAYLKKLKEKLYPRAKILKTTGGVVPTRVMDLSKSGFFIIGDAGRLTDPLSGGGIANAIKSGFLAGIYSSRILAGKDNINNYYRELKKEIIDEIRFHEKVRIIYLKLNNDDFKELINVLDKIFKDKTVKDIDSKNLVRQILRSSPRLLKVGFRLLRHVIGLQ